MQFFPTHPTPSAVAASDYEGLILAHQALIQRARRYAAGSQARHDLGLATGSLGGLTGAGVLVAVGAGALSATVLPVVLPIAAIVGVAGLLSAVLNRIASGQAARLGARLTQDLEVLKKTAAQPGAVVGATATTVPSLGGLAERLDAQQARTAPATVAAPAAPSVASPSGRRPGA